MSAVLQAQLISGVVDQLCGTSEGLDPANPAQSQLTTEHRLEAGQRAAGEGPGGRNLTVYASKAKFLHQAFWGGAMLVLAAWLAYKHASWFSLVSATAGVVVLQVTSTYWRYVKPGAKPLLVLTPVGFEHEEIGLVRWADVVRAKVSVGKRPWLALDLREHGGRGAFYSAGIGESFLPGLAFDDVVAFARQHIPASQWVE